MALTRLRTPEFRANTNLYLSNLPIFFATIVASNVSVRCVDSPGSTVALFCVINLLRSVSFRFRAANHITGVFELSQVGGEP